MRAYAVRPHHHRPMEPADGRRAVHSLRTYSSWTYRRPVVGLGSCSTAAKSHNRSTVSPMSSSNFCAQVWRRLYRSIRTGNRREKNVNQKRITSIKSKSEVYMERMRTADNGAPGSPPCSDRSCQGTLPDWRLLPRHRRPPKKTALADARTLLVSRTRAKFGDRAFSAAGPQFWNYLRTQSRQPNLL